MIFHTFWVNPIWQYFATILWGLLLIRSFKIFKHTFHTYPWHILLTCTLLIGFSMIGLTLEDGILAGLSFHLLGFNLAALISNRHTAFILSSTISTLLIFAQQAQHLAALPLTIIITLLPSYLLFKLIQYLVQQYLPPQLFIYIFIRGFLGSALSMFITGLLISSIIHFSNIFPSHFFAHIFPVFFLLTWSEGFLSGIIVALLVSFYPQFLLSFSDSIYLSSQRQLWK